MKYPKVFVSLQCEVPWKSGTTQEKVPWKSGTTQEKVPWKIPQPFQAEGGIIID